MSLIVGLGGDPMSPRAAVGEGLPMWTPPRAGAPIRDSRREFGIEPVPYVYLKTRNIVMQQRDYSCGAAALATMMRYYWRQDVEEIDVLKVIEAMLTKEELKDRVENGLSIADLRRAAVKLGYQSAIGKMTIEKLTESKIPVIVALKQKDFNHFVVVRAFQGSYVYLADPIRGNVRMLVADFSDQWIENTLLVVVKPGKTTSAESLLAIYPGECDPGALNRQMIRTRVTRMPGTW